MIVSHEHRFIFLRTEKTGGTSLSAALASVIALGDFQADQTRPAWAPYSPIHFGALRRKLPGLFGLHPHATASQARAVLGRKVFDGYYKFAMERNPWDRQVSLYAHRAWKRGRTARNFDSDMRSPWYRSTEYCRMHNWSIYAIGDTVVADKVLRYEHLDDELEALWRELKIENPPTLANLRCYESERAHYSNYYSPSTCERVRRWYRREIEALGYEFDDRNPAPRGRA